MKRLAALLLALAVAPVGAQEKPPTASKPAPAPPQGYPPVSESVEVSITNIEVVVTDSKGKRVPNLTKDDFQILQDSIPQTITNFYAVSGGRVLLEDGKTISIEEPAIAKEPSEVPEELKARYVLYIDNLNIQPINRNRMFKRLNEFVEQTVGKQAEAMVVTFNRSLKVRRKFTNDASEILQVLQEIEGETGGATSQVGDRKDALQKINDAQSSSEAEGIARQYSEAYRNDLEFTVDGIKTTIDSLAGMTGRKVLVYVSDGIPQTVGLELYDVIQQKFRETANTLEQFEYDMTSRYTSIVQAANAQGVMIWALDASGLTVDDMMTAENRTMDVRPSNFFSRTNTQAPLQMFAEETGGRAAINTNDWKSSLDELSSDFTNFYSLGYRSSRATVDKPHRIEVVVKRKGLTARFRHGLVEKSVETRTSEAVLASLHYARMDNPLGISVTTGAAKPYDRDYYLMPVRISVPIGKLGLVPSGDRYEGSFSVYFVVLDASEKQSDLAVQRQKVEIPAKDFEKAQSKDFYYDVSLICVPGGQKLAVALRDTVTSQTSYVQKSFFISVLPPEKKAS
ncbi:MAG TPA: VWA domain-containing protein [Thermoanaerobaculia bacterium]|nr:VWA domain-containing protein [Thermoanaerobaculia bacterium]